MIIISKIKNRDGDNSTQVNKIHFVGIGGSGMSPLAEILHSMDYSISGSDVNESDNVKRMRALGIDVVMEQSADNIDKFSPDLIIYTSAVGEDNPEVQRGHELEIDVLERGQLLGIITHMHEKCIAVAGTHGKTTTTSMISQILIDADKNPTLFIGGRLPLIGANGRAGSDKLMVCEACEFQNHYLSMKATTGVILNVDADHLDFFGDLDNVISSFGKFASLTSENLIVNADDENALAALKRSKPRDGQRVITFGRKNISADWTARNVMAVRGAYFKYDLYCGEDFFAAIELGVPGEYNILNSVGAAIAASLAGASPQEIADGLLSFTGAGRRFEFLGEFAGVTVADDYAHHPAEITATLTAAKKLEYKRVWAVFQPFTFTRTFRHLDEFAEALKIADRVILSDIMGSREVNTSGVSSSDITSKISGGLHIPKFDEIADYVAANAESGDLVITMGGGDVYKCARMIAKRLEERA